VSAARATALRAQADALEAQARALRDEADAIDVAPLSAPVGTFLTVDEFARANEVSRRTVFDWIRDGLPSVKRGRLRRIDGHAARAWLERKGAA
jgi:excisionase family DNA binding protein